MLKFALAAVFVAAVTAELTPAEEARLNELLEQQITQEEAELLASGGEAAYADAKLNNALVDELIGLNLRAPMYTEAGADGLTNHLGPDQDASFTRYSKDTYTTDEVKARMNSLQGQMTSVLSTDALAANIAAAVNASLQENAVLAGLWAEQQEITDAVAATVDEIAVAQGLALNALKVDLVEAIKGVPALVEAEAAERDKGAKALDKKLSDFQAEVEKQLKVVDELPDQVSASVDDALKPLASAVTIIDRIKLTYQGDPKIPVYRWNHWFTYDQSFSWYDGNNGRSFGGVAPSSWTDDNHRAWDMNQDWKYIRRFFVRKGYGHEYGATICSECYFMYSSTTGRMCGTVFRIKNVASSAVGWNPEFMYTSWGGWGEDASASMNGASNWRHHCGGSFCRTNINFNVPASDGPGGRTSTIIFVTGGTTAYHVGYNRWERANILMFNDNALKLPNGLEYVDDMDTMTGSWKD